MKKTLLFLFLSLGLFAQNSRPNIIHIVADDIAYDDLSCFGAKDIKTPNLDKLAKEGISFSNFNAPHPTCTPTRVALLTGRYAPRANQNTGLDVLFPDAKIGLDPKLEVSLAQILKQNGYATAIYGKWHVGHLPQFLPPAHGFDDFYGIPYPNDHTPERLGNTGSRGYPQVALIEGDKVIKRLDNNDLAEVPHEFVRKVCGFIRERSKDKKPFYLQYSNIETHTPWFLPKGFEGTSKAGAFGNAVEYLDRSVGIILGQLREAGLHKNTLIVFTADNGALVHEYPELENCFGKYAKVDTNRHHIFREGKYQARYNGGTHVACIMKWADVTPQNTVNQHYIDGSDLFTTFVKLAGGEIPKDRVIDGKDISEYLTGNDKKAVRNIVYLMRGVNDIQGIIKGDWKLAIINPKSEKTELYNLKNDISETKDLAKENPIIVKELWDLYKKAQFNVKNDLPLDSF